MVSAFSKLGLTHKAYGWRGIKNHRYTYVVSNGYAPGEPRQEFLYDDAEDPMQLNRREIEPECQEPLIQELRGRLSHYLNLTEDPFLWTGNKN